MQGVSDAGSKLTKAQVEARDAILRHKRFMASSWYSKAKMDDDIVKFLRAVAGVDMSVFEDGIVVTTRRIPVYENVALEEATRTAGEIRRELKTLKGVHEEEISEFFKNLNDDALERAEELLAPIRARQAEEVAALESELANVSSAAKVEGAVTRSMAPTRYEEEPVFFTYTTPNGGTARLRFTSEEWDSLYEKPMPAAERRAAESRRRSTRQKMIPVQRRVAEWQQQLEVFEANVAEVDRMIASFDPDFNPRSPMNNFKEPATQPTLPDFPGPKAPVRQKREWAAAQMGYEYDAYLRNAPKGDKARPNRMLDQVYREEVARLKAEHARALQAWKEGERIRITRMNRVDYMLTQRAQRMANVQEMRRELARANDELQKLATEYAKDTRIVKVRDPQVQSAALAKVRILVQGPEGQDNWLETLMATWGDVNRPVKKSRKKRARLPSKDVTPTVQPEAAPVAPVQAAAEVSEEEAKKLAEEATRLANERAKRAAEANLGNNRTIEFMARKLGGDVDSAREAVRRKALTVDASERRARLEQMWDENPSKKTLAEAERLAAEAHTEAYQNGAASVRMHTKAEREARKAAQSARRNLSEVERGLVRVVDELRTAELGAARVAGATIMPDEQLVDVGTTAMRAVGDTRRPLDPTGMVERGAPIAEAQTATALTRPVTYKFRGVTYEIPTVQQVVANPQKYLRQFRERSTFFRELSPGVKPVALDSADMTTRKAVAASKALDVWGNYVRRTALNQSMEVTGDRLEDLNSLLNAWARDVNTLKGALNSFEEAMKAERALGIENVIQARRGVDTVMDDFLDRMTSISALYDEDIDMASMLDILLRAMPGGGRAEMGDAERLFIQKASRFSTRSNALRNVAAQLEQAIKVAPTLDTIKGTKKLTGEARVQAMRVISDFVEEADALLGNAAKVLADNEDAYPLWSALVRAKLAEGRFAQEQLRLGQAQAALDAAKEPMVIEKIIKPYQRGYKKAAEQFFKESGLVQAKSLKMPSYAVDAGAMDILSSMQRLNDGAVVRDFARFISGYTGFFKAYATLTPGFHVRNAISNAFQIFAGGGEARNMGRALNTYKSFASTVRNVTRFDEWDAAVERWLLTVPEADREAARIAYGVSVALHGGNVSEAFREISKMKRGVLTDNVATRLSRNVGHRVEGSARFIMAFDAAKRGMSYNEVFNHTRRFLFDYHDPTILDETVRNIVPFWTWMSRNLPLQITNQWLNPKPYVLYSKFAKNFRAEDREDMPEWMRRQNPLALGGGFVLTPDLPMNNIEKQVRDLLTPGDWLQYANPALRVPVELMAGRKSFSGAPIEGYAPADGVLAPFVPLLEALGQVERGPDGRPVISQQAKYALESLIPTVGQASRLFPSMEQSGNRTAAATGRYFGLPIQAWGPEQANNEQISRLMALQEFAQRQRQIREAGQ